MSPARSYREVMARLAELPPALAAEQEQIGQWYERQCAAAEAAVARADKIADEAETALRASEATVEWTEAESRRLWRTLERRLGPIGPLPSPARNTDPEDDPLRLLRQTSAAIGRTTTEPRTRPPWLVPTLALSGFTLILVGLMIGSLWLASH